MKNYKQQIEFLMENYNMVESRAKEFHQKDKNEMKAYHKLLKFIPECNKKAFLKTLSDYRTASNDMGWLTGMAQAKHYYNSK